MTRARLHRRAAPVQNSGCIKMEFLGRAMEKNDAAVLHRSREPSNSAAPARSGTFAEIYARTILKISKQPAGDRNGCILIQYSRLNFWDALLFSRLIIPCTSTWSLCDLSSNGYDKQHFCNEMIEIKRVNINKSCYFLALSLQMLVKRSYFLLFFFCSRNLRNEFPLFVFFERNCLLPVFFRNVFHYSRR